MRRNFKGFSFVGFLLFLTFVTIPKNILLFLLRGQFDHVQAFLKAIFWNIKDGFQGIFGEEKSETILDIKKINVPKRERVNH